MIGPSEFQEQKNDLNQHSDFQKVKFEEHGNGKIENNEIDFNEDTQTHVRIESGTQCGSNSGKFCQKLETPKNLWCNQNTWSCLACMIIYMKFIWTHFDDVTWVSNFWQNLPSPIVAGLCGTYKYPQNCELSKCEYYIHWRPLEDQTKVLFTMFAKNRDFLSIGLSTSDQQIVSRSFQRFFWTDIYPKLYY